MGPGIFALVVGAAIVVTGVVGRMGRLRNNGLIGVRTAATRSSDANFRRGNRAAAPAVIAGGVAAMACGVVAFFVPQDAAPRCAGLGMALMAGLALFGGYLANRAVDRD